MLAIRISQNLTSSGEGVLKNDGDGGNELNCATVVFISKNYIFLRILQNSIPIFLLEYSCSSTIRTESVYSAPSSDVVPLWEGVAGP